MIHDKINFVGNSELIFPVCVMVAQLTLDQFVEVQILNREPYENIDIAVICNVFCFFVNSKIFITLLSYVLIRLLQAAYPDY